MSENILVTGASGLVGQYVIPLIKKKYSVFTTSHSAHTDLEQVMHVDLTSRKEVEKMLDYVQPSLIVNLAALTDVDRCETDRELAKGINWDFASSLSDYLQSNRTFLIHISTDYVFNGEKGNYKEDDAPSPLNWYGTTKLHAENEIMRKLLKDQWCIVRTSSLFGFHRQKQTFPLYIIGKLKKREPVKVIIDQFSSSTYGADLAKTIYEIIDARINGVIHFAGSSRLSRYEQAKMITEVFGFDTGLVHSVKLEDMNYKAPRPRDSSLDTSKATSIFSNKPRDFLNALRLFKDELITQNFI